MSKIEKSVIWCNVIGKKDDLLCFLKIENNKFKYVGNVHFATLFSKKDSINFSEIAEDNAITNNLNVNYHSPLPYLTALGKFNDKIRNGEFNNINLNNPYYINI